ncbi:MAG: aspartate aminotransferase family protein [Desulfurococcales archaeon]|nr:aspartate aminotransferase family protein [Desulfurococcales archaeon]
METDRLYEKAVELIPGGAPGRLRREFHKTGPLVLKEAYGSRLVDVDGNTYLDYHMAFGAILLGHRDSDVVEAVKREAELIDLHGAGITDVEIDYAELIHKLIPTAERIVFTNSGTEAVLLAFRLARAYTGRNLIIKFEGNYHGWHDYALINVSTSLSEKGKHAETMGVPGGVLESVEVLPYNDVDSLRNFMAEHGDKVAGIILEPVAHSMGVVPATREFLTEVERLSKTYGSLLIFDEIITGIRHNIHGLQSELGVRPHLTTLGKAIANGYPVAALVGLRDVMDMLVDSVVSSGTYSAHPIAMAAGKAALMKAVNLRADLTVSKIGYEHSSTLRDLVEDLGIEAYVASYRSIISIYFGLDRQPMNLREVNRADKRAYAIFNKEMRRKGILFTPNPRKRLNLSTAHTTEDLEKFRSSAEYALKKLRSIAPVIRTR